MSDIKVDEREYQALRMLYVVACEASASQRIGFWSAYDSCACCRKSVLKCACIMSVVRAALREVDDARFDAERGDPE